MSDDDQYIRRGERYVTRKEERAKGTCGFCYGL